MTLPTVHNTTNPQARGFHAQLDNLLLRLSVAPDRQVKITSAESQAQRVQTSESPEEFVSEFGDVYARSDFTGGSGLDLAHRRGAGQNAASRYWDSYGVKVVDPEPGHRRELGLLEATEEELSLTSDPIRLLYTGGVLYATDGVNVRRTSDPTASSPTWASDNPTTGASAALSLASLGSTVYAAFGVSGLYKRASGSWSNVYTDDADGVWAAKGRLLVSDGVDLWEEDGTARPTAGSELRILAAGDTWVDVVDAGSAILAAATDGYVYAFAADADTGDLALIGQTRFETETPTALGAAQGIVFVATTSGADVGRLWRCEVNDGVLQSAQVIREWDGAAPRVIVADRENVYTIVSEDADESHCWRYSVVTGGMHRWWIYDGLSAASDAHGLALVDGRMFAGLSDEGVYRTLTTYRDDGWLITPLGDFFTAEEKAWVTASAEVGPVPSGGVVQLFWSGDPAAINDADSVAWVKVLETTSVAGAVVDTPIVNRISRYAAGLVRLTASSDNTEAPAVRSVGFRAYPEQPDIVIDLPVNVSDVVEAPGRRRARVRGRGSELYAELQRREGRPCLLQLYRPTETVRGVVQRVATPQSALSRRGAQTLFSLLTVRGRRTTVTEMPLEEGTTGTCLTGYCLTGMD